MNCITCDLPLNSDLIDCKTCICGYYNTNSAITCRFCKVINCNCEAFCLHCNVVFYYCKCEKDQYINMPDLSFLVADKCKDCNMLVSLTSCCLFCHSKKDVCPKCISCKICGEPNKKNCFCCEKCNRADCDCEKPCDDCGNKSLKCFCFLKEKDALKIFDCDTSNNYCYTCGAPHATCHCNNLKFCLDCGFFGFNCECCLFCLKLKKEHTTQHFCKDYYCLIDICRTCGNLKDYCDHY